MMKVCCFGKQPDSEASGVTETDESGSDSPTSHFAESNTISKEVAAQLSDCTFKVEGKELKVHSQVSRNGRCPPDRQAPFCSECAQLSRLDSSGCC